MSESPTPSDNPYKTPAQSYEPSAAAQAYARDVDTRETMETIKKFREQMHALGALWIIIGAIALGLSLYTMNEMPGDENAFGVVVVFGFFGLLWFGLGIATCFKLIGAVYVGLVISYLSLLANILSLNICGTIVVIVVILQAHRVIKWAGEMRNSGIPLNSLPPGRLTAVLN